MNMFIEEILHVKSGKKELREFGFVFAGLFFVLSIFLYFKNRTHPLLIYCLALGAFFLLSGLLFPIILLPIQKVWMTFAKTLGFFMTRLILCIFYYLVLTPLALLRRLSGKDVLDIDFRVKKDSYWKPKQQHKTYTKQY